MNITNNKQLKYDLNNHKYVSVNDYTYVIEQVNQYDCIFTSGMNEKDTNKYTYTYGHMQRIFNDPNKNVVFYN